MDRITNLDFLKSFTKGDNAKMEKYIRMFLKNVPGLLENIDKYLSEKDWANLRVTVHSIKPQLTFMGAKDASSFAQSIESDLDSKNDLEAIPGKIDELKGIVNQMMDELSGEVEKL